MANVFTEKDTEQYYDQQDDLYQSFWSSDGSVHWGYFDQEGMSFAQAGQRLTDVLIEKSGIDCKSVVLDVGCGNGTTVLHIASKFDCRTVGVDLSGVRIKNALKNLKTQPRAIQENAKFIKSSGASLPFKNDYFSTVLSQSSIYHIHDKKKALSEIYRILKKGGIFVFDDLFKPKPKVSIDTQKNVFDRLLFDTPFSFHTYQTFLDQIGFKVIEAQDISQYLKESYKALIDVLGKKLSEGSPHKEHYKKLISAYQGTMEAVDKSELGYGLFVCKK